jgi:hypothetical protein
MSQEVLQPLSEQQQVDYIRAELIAWAANHALDERKEAAYKLAGNVHKEGVIVSSDLTAEIKTDLIEADIDYNYYRIAAEALMPSRSDFYRNEASEVAQSIEPFASDEVWGAMTAEQKVKASAVRSAIAEGQLGHQGVSEATLRVVQAEKDSESQFVLIYTGAGVDIGDHGKDYDKARTYNSVMASKNDEVFQVEVNGVTYDTRSGMTDEAYVAKVEDARNRDVTLPDSQQLRDETGDLRTWTMLTGEPLTADGLVLIRNVNEGQVGRNVDSPDDGDRTLRVCPAVVIE